MSISMSMAANERPVVNRQVFSDRTPNLQGARQFYSLHSGMVIMMNRDANGQHTMLSANVAYSDALHFINPGNSGKFGLLVTADPDIIAFLDKRRADQLASNGESDILTPEEVMQKALPPEVLIAKLKAENEALRKDRGIAGPGAGITQNRLAEDINTGAVAVGQASNEPAKARR